MPWQMQWTGSPQQQTAGNWGEAAWANSKGKGKGKGKEEPSGRKWPCPSEKCKAHHKGSSIMMLPHVKCCRVCSTPKAAAPAIEQAALLKLRADAKEEMEAKSEAKSEAPPSKRKQKLARNAETKRLAKEKEEKEKKEAAKAPPANANANANGAPLPPPPPTPPNDAGAKEWLPRQLPDKVLTDTAKVEDSVAAVLRSLTLDKFPEDKSPDDLDREISTKLASLQPAELAVGQQALETLIDDLKAQALLGEGRLPPDIIEAMKTRAKEEEVKLEKLKKKVQPMPLQHANLVQGRAEAQTAFLEQQQRTEAGQTKAQERSSQRFQLVNATVETLKKLAEALTEHDQNFAEAHAFRGEALDSKQKALLARYDTLIEAASSGGDASMAPAAEAPAASEEPPAPQLEELAAWKEKFNQLKLQQEAQTTALQEQISTLMDSQAKAAAASTVAAAAEAVAATDKKAREDAKAAELVAEEAAKGAWAVTTAQFEVTTACDSGKLPDVLPDESTLEHCSNLFYLLQHWSLAGGSVPFCLGDLSKVATAKEGTELLVKDLLGPLWEALFPSGATETTVFPRQAVLIILHALERLKARFERVEETRKAAGASYAVISEISKKRRTTGQ